MTQLAINLYLEYPVTEEETLLAVKKAGFDGFFLQYRQEKQAEIKKLAAVAAREGMIFQSVHAPYNRMNRLWRREESTQEVLAEQIECIRFCAELGVPLAVVHPYCGFDKPAPTEEGLENFSKIVSAAEKYGVKVGFENVENEEYLAAIIRALGNSPAVGLCWDTGHEQCYNFGNDIVGRYANGKLFGTHFNDNLGITDRENITWHDDLHLLPYDGNVDWKNVMARLRKENYQGVISFEVKSKNKPGKHTHDRYERLTLDEYLALAYARARAVIAE